MKGFNKLVLASAVIAASTSAFAMQAMDDESMSAATGQDGLTINLNNNISNLDVKWVDRDGTGVAPYDNAGALHISGLGITANDVQIDIDAGGDVGTGASADAGKGQLLVHVQLNGATVIDLSSAKIAVADAVNVPASGWTTETLADRSLINTADETTIIDFDPTASLTIAAGGDINIRLGNRAATDHLISITGNLGDVSLTGVKIHDNGTLGGGVISIGTLSVADVNANLGIDVVTTGGFGGNGGLKIDTSGTTVGTVGLERLAFGGASASSIGDVYLSATMAASGNTVTVSGH